MGRFVSCLLFFFGGVCIVGAPKPDCDTQGEPYAPKRARFDESTLPLQRAAQQDTVTNPFARLPLEIWYKILTHYAPRKVGERFQAPFKVNSACVFTCKQYVDLLEIVAKLRLSLSVINSDSVLVLKRERISEETTLEHFTQVLSQKHEDKTPFLGTPWRTVYTVSAGLFDCIKGLVSKGKSQEFCKFRRAAGGIYPRDDDPYFFDCLDWDVIAQFPYLCQLGLEHPLAIECFFDKKGEIIKSFPLSSFGLFIDEYEGEWGKWQEVCNAHPVIESGVHTFEAYDVPEIITLQNFSNLRKLHVRGCHNLESLKGFSHLREIRLFDTGLSTISDLPNVRNLEVDSCANLRKIYALPRLEILEIHRCPALESVQLSLPLEKMVFDECPNLKSIECMTK